MELTVDARSKSDPGAHSSAVATVITELRSSPLAASPELDVLARCRGAELGDRGGDLASRGSSRCSSRLTARWALANFRAYTVTVSKADKIKEARFFLHQLAETTEVDPFRYVLSAFLSCSRSVMQYAHRDVQGDVVRQAWYDEKMAGSLVLQFFKEERDFNIHERPVSLRSRHTIEARIQVNIAASLSVTVRRADGSVEELGGTEPTTRPNPIPSPGKHTVQYFFKGWEPQDVIELCRMYVDELAAVIADGLALGYILP